MWSVNIRLSDIIKNQADRYNVDFQKLAEKAANDLSNRFNVDLNLDIEIKASLLPPLTVYYPQEKAARIFMFPRVFALKPIRERDNAIAYTLKHELYEAISNKPTFIHVAMNELLEKMIPSFDNSTLRLKTEENDTDLKLMSDHCITDVTIDRELTKDKNDAEGFLTYHLFPHYCEIALLERRNFTLYDFMAIFLSRARVARIAYEIKPNFTGTKFRSCASIYIASFDKLVNGYLRLPKLQEHGKNIFKELGSEQPSEDTVFSEIMAMKDGISEILA